MVTDDGGGDGLPGIAHEDVRRGRELVGARFDRDAQRLSEEIRTADFAVEWIDAGNDERVCRHSSAPWDAAGVGEDDCNGCIPPPRREGARGRGSV
jgi:hypothetical protein